MADVHCLIEREVKIGVHLGLFIGKLPPFSVSTWKQNQGLQTVPMFRHCSAQRQVMSAFEKGIRAKEKIQEQTQKNGFMMLWHFQLFPSREFH